MECLRKLNSLVVTTVAKNYKIWDCFKLRLRLSNYRWFYTQIAA